ncbi:MAG: recombinase family protein [Bacteroidia bacterium]
MENKINVCLFIRVSTNKQDYQRQVLELTNYCNKHQYTVAKTIATKITGTKTSKDRPDLQELFKAVDKKEFSKVVVCEVSRIGRNARDIRHTIDYLHDRKISIVFKNLGGLESLDEKGNESFITNVIINIYAELAQEEKRILSDRIRSGMESAKDKGKRIGRPKGLEDEADVLKRYTKLLIDLRAGLSVRKAAKVHGVASNTVLKVKRVAGI